MPDNTIGGVTLCLSHIVEKQDTQYATLDFNPWSYEPLRETKSVSIPDITKVNWVNESKEERRIRCETEYHGIHVYEFRSESCWTTDGRRIFMKAE